MYVLSIKTIEKKFTKNGRSWRNISFLVFVWNVITRLRIKIEKFKDDTCLASWFVLNSSLTRLRNTRTRPHIAVLTILHQLWARYVSRINLTFEIDLLQSTVLVYSLRRYFRDFLPYFFFHFFAFHINQNHDINYRAWILKSRPQSISRFVCRPIQDTFKKYLDIDTFKIFSKKTI